MEERHRQIQEQGRTKHDRFVLKRNRTVELENLTNNHIIEMQQLEDTTDDARQVILCKRNIKAQKKRQVRTQQGRELLTLRNTPRYTPYGYPLQRVAASNTAYPLPRALTHLLWS